MPWKKNNGQAYGRSYDCPLLWRHSDNFNTAILAAKVCGRCLNAISQSEIHTVPDKVPRHDPPPQKNNSRSAAPVVSRSSTATGCARPATAAGPRTGRGSPHVYGLNRDPRRPGRGPRWPARPGRRACVTRLSRAARYRRATTAHRVPRRGPPGSHPAVSLAFQVAGAAFPQ